MISILTIFVRAIVQHNNIPEDILLVKIIPLIKDRDGNAEDSDNYRSFCLSSVLLKIIDWARLSRLKRKSPASKMVFLK